MEMAAVAGFFVCATSYAELITAVNRAAAVNKLKMLNGSAR